MRSARAVAAAKINLALVVGPRRGDGLHDLATVLQRVDLCDRLELEPAPELEVAGFAGDAIVRAALEGLAAEAGVEPAWRVRLAKEIPVAAGLGGGSADAAAALRLANDALADPLGPERLHALAAALGADVPFFLEPGPKLAEGAGERLTPLDVPQDFWVLLVRPTAPTKESTAAVYARFDELGGGPGFAERRRELLAGLEVCRRPRHLATLPPNDLAEATGGGPLVADLGRAGAFRADVSGAGPAVYGLFHRREDARAAAR
ncbi:MAG: 4-(cytidine 5'-diphospho)-2-C-methyl-D-erythritol kinase, partial [Gaiellaceae bacterium]